jgi:hypothetical protein
MPEVTLHVLNAGVVLNMCRRCTPECLMRHVTDAGLFSQRLQMPLQIIPHAERAPGRTREEEGARIIAVGMPMIQASISRWRPGETGTKLSPSSVFVSPIRSSPLCRSLRASSIRSCGPSKIFNTQNQNLRWPQAAHGDRRETDEHGIPRRLKTVHRVSCGPWA